MKLVVSGGWREGERGEATERESVEAQPAAQEAGDGAPQPAWCEPP